MKRISFFSEKMLLSIVAVSVGWGFMACSSDDDSVKAPDTIVANENDPIGEPIGLVYTDFITEKDVVHNADTTVLTISKALADKKGITNFVNRPMGIWDKKEHLSYLRRATEQRLEGDHYVLKVVRSSIAEVTNGQDVMLSTDIYYNPTVAISGKTRAASFGDMEAAKYVDDNNVIHPMAIHFLPMPDNGSNDEEVEFEGDYEGYQSGSFTIEELYAMGTDGGNNIFDDIWSGIKKVAKKVVSVAKTVIHKIEDATSYEVSGSGSKSTDFNVKLKLKKKIACGEDKKDTVGITFTCPIDFKLGYYISCKAKGSIKTAEIPIPEYFETYIDGALDVQPQLVVGFSKELSLPKDKQRIEFTKFPPISITFSIGPVPVNISIYPKIYMKITASVAGDAYLGMKYHISNDFKAGFKYEHGSGFSGIADGNLKDNKFEFIKPTLELTLKAGVGLYFGVDVIIEQLAGPTFNIGPQINGQAKLSYEVGKDLKFTADVTAGIGGEAGGTIKIFGFELAQWQAPFTIGPQWPIYKSPSTTRGIWNSYSGNSTTTDLSAGKSYFPVSETAE